MARMPAQEDPDIEPRFFTLEQTARYLNVSVQQVYALARSGELPAIKLGGRGVWRVDRTKLDDYLEKLIADTRDWTKAHPFNTKQDSNEAE